MDYPVSPAIAALMAQAKAIGETLQPKLDSLELSNWDDKHETQLKQYFGYTDKSVAKRKRDLIKRTSK